MEKSETNQAVEPETVTENGGRRLLQELPDAEPTHEQRMVEQTHLGHILAHSLSKNLNGPWVKPRKGE